MKKRMIRHIHFLTVLIMGISATLLAIFATRLTIPLLWLGILCIVVLVDEPEQFPVFFRRFAQVGSLLVIVSLLHIAFRRTGDIILSWQGFPIMYSEGLREALLLWIRFMLLFVLAAIFSQVSLFHFILFFNKLKISFEFTLLILTALRLIPFMFQEAKRTLWFMRFRGVTWKGKPLRHQLAILKKLLYPLLMYSMHYVSHSALALELRGYGQSGDHRIPQPYPLRGIDYGIIAVVLIINLAALWR